MDTALNVNQNLACLSCPLGETHIYPDEDTNHIDTSCLGLFNPER